MPAADPLKEYLSSQSPAARPVVTALDRAIRGAEKRFDVAVTYHMLMYTLDMNWQTWVCAIGTSKSSVALRFLYGVLLEDPRHVLRPGTSVLMTWDFGFDDKVEERVVKAYVREAVSRYDDYKTNSKEILARSRERRT